MPKIKFICSLLLIAVMESKVSAQKLCGQPSKKLQAVCRRQPKVLVSDAATAIRIAISVCKPIYGDREIESERPFQAMLAGDSVWIVSGSLSPVEITKKDGKIIAICATVGGVAYARISKTDGRVIEICHGK